MNLRIFGLVNDSIVDGPGLRYAIFTQGCPHGCKGCHNPDSHDMGGGYEENADVILDKIRKNPLLDGVTFSGGEPFLQAEPLAYIAKKVHEMGLSVVVYTGYTWEQLLHGANDKNKWRKLLENTDILIDGPFIEEERSIELSFKGSRNQRIIDVKKSLASGNVIVCPF